MAGRAGVVSPQTSILNDTCIIPYRRARTNYFDNSSEEELTSTTCLVILVVAGIANPIDIDAGVEVPNIDPYTKLGRDRQDRLYASRYLNQTMTADEAKAILREVIDTAAADQQQADDGPYGRIE